jgi:hypothetical protein
MFVRTAETVIGLQLAEMPNVRIIAVPVIGARAATERLALQVLIQQTPMLTAFQPAQTALPVRIPKRQVPVRLQPAKTAREVYGQMPVQRYVRLTAVPVIGVRAV